jgi:hypothetical protein
MLCARATLLGRREIYSARGCQSTLIEHPFRPQRQLQTQVLDRRAVVSAFHEETSRLFERAATPVEAPPALPTHCLLPYDHLGPPSPSSGDVERVDFSDFAPNAYNMPFGVQPDDLYAIFPLYPSLSVMTTDCTLPGHLLRDVPERLRSLCTGTGDANLRDIPTGSVRYVYDHHHRDHFRFRYPPPPAPVDPSTMTVYPPYFGYDYDPSEVPSVPDNASVASLPSSSPPASSYRGSSGSDCEGDVDCTLPSDDDNEYLPAQAASPPEAEGVEVASQSKSPSPKTFSPARSTSSKSGSSSRARRRSHPYKRANTSRNLQRDHGPTEINKRVHFFCPVVGCSTNRRTIGFPTSSAMS